jgi:oligoendopeptidase F
VYQYATCFASAARIAATLTHGSDTARAEARERYLTLLRSGGSDHPMTLLKNAGIDLSQPETVQATVDQLTTLVDRLEAEM